MDDMINLNRFDAFADADDTAGTSGGKVHDPNPDPDPNNACNIPNPNPNSHPDPNPNPNPVFARYTCVFSNEVGVSASQQYRDWRTISISNAFAKPSRKISVVTELL